MTAQKRLEAAQDVPNTVNALSGRKIDEENIGRQANEIMSYIPNASGYGSAHQRPRWWIRGVGSGNPQLDMPSQVGFYLDDVYIANSSATNFPIFDLARVEVLSGPQGTLWGKNTTGGAINVISREPDFLSNAYGKLEYGTHDDKVAEFAFGGPLVDQRLAYRISVHQEDEGNRYYNVNNGQHEGKLRDGAYRAQLLFTPMQDIDVLLNVHARRFNTQGGTTFGSPATGASYFYPVVQFNFPTADNQVSSIGGNRWSGTDIDQDGANLKLRWRLGNYELTAISAYEDYRSEVSAGPGSPYVSGANWTHQTYSEKQLSQEIRFASPREDRWNWIVGAFYFWDSIDTDSAAVQLAGYPTIQGRTSTNSSLVDDGYDHRTVSRALFASTKYSFTDRLDATLGWRWTTEAKTYAYYRNAYATALVGQQDRWWDYTSGTGSTATSFPGTGLSRSWDAVTYDFTPSYKIADNQLTYARYAHGVKSGGFNTRVQQLSQIYAVDPEKLDSVEVGYKSAWLDHRVNFNANVFHYRYRNQQVNISGPYGVVDPTTGVGANLSILQNAKLGHANGAEFTLEALLTDRIHVNANLGFLFTKFDDLTITDPTTGQSLRQVDGAEFVRSPHVSSLVQVDYRVPVPGGSSVLLGLDWKFSAKQYYYVVPQDTVSQLQQGAYSLFAARAIYTLPDHKTTVALYGNNLFNKHYIAHGSVVSQSANTTGWSYSPGDLRTIALNLQHRF